MLTDWRSENANWFLRIISTFTFGGYTDSIRNTNMLLHSAG